MNDPTHAESRTLFNPERNPVITLNRVKKYVMTKYHRLEIQQETTVEFDVLACVTHSAIPQIGVNKRSLSERDEL